MIVKIESTEKRNFSCSLCEKGVLRKGDQRLTYPYKEVITVVRSLSGGIKVGICRECLETLYQFKNLLEPTENG